MISVKNWKTLGITVTVDWDTGEELIVWVFFADKSAERSGDLRLAREYLSERALRRTSEAGIALDEKDIPVAETYVLAVENIGAELRRESRWLNAASFVIHPRMTEEIAELDESKRIVLCKEAQALIADAVPSIWICEEPYIIVARSNVKGYVYNPAYNQGLDVYHMWLE